MAGAAPDEGLARPAAIAAAGTVASRVTGLLRVLALTYALGIAETRLADTFNIANTLPNMLYELILGGILSSVFIPLVVDTLREQDGIRRVGALVWTSLAVLLAFSALASLAAPWLVRVFTFRAGQGSAGQTDLAAFLFRFFAFQIFFYGATAIGVGLLNARGRFGVAAFAPVANNVVAIIVFLAFAASVGRVGVDVPMGGRLLLGIGTTAAVAAMALLHVVPVLRVYGWLPPRVSLSDPLVRRFARLSVWVFVYVATSQVSLGVTFALAYGVQGGTSAYVTAFTFYQLPYAVLAVSVTTALVPRLAERAADGDLPGFRERLEHGVSATIAAVVPAAVAYAIVARPALRVLLQRGQVSPESVEYVARLVQILTVSLLSFSLWILFVRSFYALQDTRTPARLNLVCAAAFVAVDFPLYAVLKVEGLSWAHTVGYTVAMVVAARALGRRLGRLRWRRLVARAVPVVVASAVMAMVMLPLVSTLEHRLTSLPGQAATTVVAGLAGGLAFLAAALLLDVEDVLRLRRLVRW